MYAAAGEGITNERILQVSNPMTENYESVRDSNLSSLLASESASANAVYPHKIFEVGKVAFKDSSGILDTGTVPDAANTGTATRHYLGFLHAEADASFNTISAQVQNLLYYLNREYTVSESADVRFIPGRAANVLYKGNIVGVFGEIHPAVLAAWNITTVCTACELDVDYLI
jgi:phenylalanyl-tRNA synthetase beta chain